MKKAISIFMIGFATLCFAKNANTIESKNQPTLINSTMLKNVQPQSKKGMFVWKYLYQSTCGVYFTVTLDQPIETLNYTQQQRLELDLIIKNNEICANRPKQPLEFYA
ncbi:MAG: hypothetical protein JSS94_09535 [Bacteroidetes bacterium]|nr:hypothetical protein [Bacteroidota bacterium]